MYVAHWFSMSFALWHYPSIPTWPVWPKDSKTVLGYDFGYVTDLVDTKNCKNRFLSLVDSNLNFDIWIFLSRAQFYVLYPSNRVSRSCAHKNMPNYWGGSEHFCVTRVYSTVVYTRSPTCLYTSRPSWREIDLLSQSAWCRCRYCCLFGAYSCKLNPLSDISSTIAVAEV